MFAEEDIEIGGSSRAKTLKNFKIMVKKLEALSIREIEPSILTYRATTSRQSLLVSR